MREPGWNEIAFTIPLTGAVFGWLAVTEIRASRFDFLGFWILGAAGLLGLIIASVALSNNEPRRWLTFAALALNVCAILPGLFLLVGFYLFSH
jgi:hypothetical protein